jgi:hypothetical protein
LPSWELKTKNIYAAPNINGQEKMRIYWSDEIYGQVIEPDLSITKGGEFIANMVSLGYKEGLLFSKYPFKISLEHSDNRVHANELNHTKNKEGFFIRCIKSNSNNHKVIMNEDSIKVIEIESLIENNNAIDASNEYLKLHNESEDLKSNIESSLSNYFSNYYMPLNNYEINEFIRKNSNTLNQMKIGKYDFKINNLGQILLNEIDHSSEFNYSYKTLKINQLFSFKPNYSFTLDIKDTITKPPQVDKNSAQYLFEHIYDELRDHVDEPEEKKQFKLTFNSKLSNSWILWERILDEGNIDNIENDKFYYADKNKIIKNKKRFQVLYNPYSKEQHKSFEIDFQTNSHIDTMEFSVFKQSSRFVNKEETKIELIYYPKSKYILKKKNVFIRESSIIGSIIVVFAILAGILSY